MISMRGRMFQLKNQVMSSLPAVSSIGVGLASGVYIYKFMKNDKEINVNLPTFADMREYSGQLRQAFLVENDEDEFGLKLFDALLRSIQINDVSTANMMLDDLLAKDMISDVIRDGLIVVSANYDKIKILELLQRKFGNHAVLRNRRARGLLGLADDEKRKATEILEQPYQSPGNINQHGMSVILRVIQKKKLEDNLYYMGFQPVYITCDLADDITQSYLHVVRARKVNDELCEDFSRTIIIDLFDYPAYEKVVEEYYRQLSAEAKQLNKVVVGTMVLTGNHFAIAQIKVSPQADNFTHAAIVYIDPLGSNLSVISSTYRPISSLPHHVFSHVKLMVSEDRNQFAAIGCSLFVSDQYETLMNLDQIMSHNTQYSFAGNKYVIFDYAEHHKYLCLQYGYDDCRDGSYAGINDFQLFRLPACLIVGKQSLEGENNTFKNEIETYVLQPNGRYKCEFDRKNVDKRESVLALMGIFRAKSHSSKEWQREFEMPFDNSGESVDMVIAKNIEPVYPGSDKNWNKRNVHSAYGLGHLLGDNIRELLDIENQRTTDAGQSRTSYKQ